MTSRDTKGVSPAHPHPRRGKPRATFSLEAWLRLVTLRRHVEDGISLRLKGSLDAGAQARQALGKLRGDLDPPSMETMLAVTELVTNSSSMRAPTTWCSRCLRVTSVWTEVTDEAGLDPATTGIPQDDKTGWACSWSSVWRTAGRGPRGHNTKVWFELRRG